MKITGHDLIGLPKDRSIAIVDIFEDNGKVRTSIVPLHSPVGKSFSEDAVSALILEQGGWGVRNPDYLKIIDHAENDIIRGAPKSAIGATFRLIAVLSLDLVRIKELENNFWQDTVVGRDDVFEDFGVYFSPENPHPERN